MCRSFKDVSSLEDLSIYIGVRKELINYVVYVKGVDSFYKEFAIPKKSGGNRIISSPGGSLKKLQKKLQKRLSEEYNDKYGNFNVSQAFIKEKNIMSNAKIHRSKKFILNLDIEDFFDEFNFGRIYGYLKKSNDFKMNEQLSVILSKIFTYKNKLPQGSPSSPILTNFIFRITDFKILKLAKKYRLDYTRYADDLTFSTNDFHFKDNYINFVNELKFLLLKNGFRINHKKTRVQYYSSRQEVTGLTVNKKINVSRKYYKDTRAQAHRMYTRDFYTIDGKDFNKLNKLEGRFSFINQVRRYNYLIELSKYKKESKEFNKLKEDKTTFSKDNNLQLHGFDEQYKKFLFYKYFIYEKKPLIFTEGKTDIRYIKAAIMKYYSDYPELVEKKDGNFKFKVDFFQRGNESYYKNIKKKREESDYNLDYNIKDYYLGLSGDGADALTRLLIYFGSKKKGSNNGYLEYFVNKLNKKNRKVAVLFDNEVFDKKKPLRNFLNQAYGKKALGNCEKLFSDGKLEIANDLYVLTIFRDTTDYKESLKNHMDKCIKDGKFFDKEGLSTEIEDLIDTSSIKIGSRSFNKDSNSNHQIYFGKQDLSLYVYKNYNSVDLTGFIPLLDQLKDLCK